MKPIETNEVTGVIRQLIDRIDWAIKVFESQGDFNKLPWDRADEWLPYAKTTVQEATAISEALSRARSEPTMQELSEAIIGKQVEPSPEAREALDKFTMDELGARSVPEGETGTDAWDAFSKFIQATRGYVPHERDSLAKDQFEIYQAGLNSLSSRIPSGELGENPVIELAICEEIKERREKGLAKYGVGVERTDLTLSQWLQHAKEEAMDLAVYLERAKRDIDAKEAELSSLRDSCEAQRVEIERLKEQHGNAYWANTEKDRVIAALVKERDEALQKLSASEVDGEWREKNPK